MINIQGTLKEIDEIRVMKEDVEIAQRRWLEKRGWSYGSSNHACLWLFEKKFKGDKRTFVCNASIAIALELGS